MSSIYVLGWGSLIWNSGQLKLHARYDWQEDGPYLPIEFARISSRDRLTLVRKKGAAPVPVLWHKMSSAMTLDDALESLRVREGCSTNKPIGYVDVRSGRQRCRDEAFASVVRDWANEKGADQVIWTDLGVNFKYKFGEYYKCTEILRKTNMFTFIPVALAGLLLSYLWAILVGIATKGCDIAGKLPGVC